MGNIDQLVPNHDKPQKTNRVHNSWYANLLYIKIIINNLPW